MHKIPMIDFRWKTNHGMLYLKQQNLFDNKR